MSEESISYGEDKENLLYILKKINVDEFGVGEEGLFRESISTVESELSTKPVGSEIQILEDIKGTDFSDPNLTSKIKPFHIKWSFGINASTGVINLTNESRKELLFSSVHMAVLYDYCTKEMRHLEGHQSVINCISTDNDGAWLVTSDSDKDGCVIIWNRKDLTPTYTLFDIYPDSGVLLMALSPCARYLVTIGEKDDEYYQTDFWLWTLGQQNSDDVFLVHKTNGPPIKISFNPDLYEQVLLIFEKQIFLLFWDPKENKFSSPAIPQIVSKHNIGTLTGGTYVKRCHECFATTTKGCILVFRSTLYSRSFDEGEFTNAKIFINAVKVTPTPIGAITTTNGIIIVGDARGHILFFDKRIKILYWLRNFSLGAITAISFSNANRKFLFEGSKILIKKRPLEADDYVTDCDYVDIVEEINNLVATDVPFDASLNNSPFVMDNFFVSTADSNIYAIDFLSNTCTPLFQVADANISAIDAHDEKPYIIIAYENGRISLINYRTKEQIADYVLPKTDDSRGDIITCIKYSHESLHLVCGRNNGDFWVLEPIVLTPKNLTPFKYTKHKVVKIEFSYSNLQLAYFDSNRTVVIFNYNYENSCWGPRGKIRSHYEDINDLKFFYVSDRHKSVLYTIGDDRHLVEYNNLKLLTDGDEVFSVTARERIEQTVIPKNFTYYSKLFGDKSIGYFLVADDNHKLKLLHETTKVPRALVLGPAYGCFKDSPVRKMKNNSMKYMIFMSKRHIGIHMLPPDGNPYKYTGYLAHPTEVCNFVLSHDGAYAFTFGVEDRCVLKWEIKQRTVELFNLMGGTELEPYYCLIEGGKNGWLFHEIQDLFFYMQILQQENIDLPRRVSDTINLTEIPDLVRTCGFYPSDFELETMMIDIRYRDFDESGVVRDEITFVEFVKLFLNHRPAYGYNFEHIKKHFEVMCSMADYPRRGRIENHDFVYFLQTVGRGPDLIQQIVDQPNPPENLHIFHFLGEPSTQLHKNLTTLLRITTYGENNFEFLPQEIDHNFLLYEVLGIDPNRTENQEYDYENRDIESEQNAFPF